MFFCARGRVICWIHTCWVGERLVKMLGLVRACLMCYASCCGEKFIERLGES
jgi:hypothetical protein